LVALAPRSECNLIFHRPANPEVYDVCGGSLVARDDDPEALQSRLRD